MYFLNPRRIASGAGMALTLLTVCLVLSASAQDTEKKDEKGDKGDADEKFVSGPQVGAFLPGPCEVFNINGESKGRPHCLVCEYGAFPVVAIFATEPADGKDGPLTALLQKLEEAIPRQDEFKLRGFVIFVSPAARPNPVVKKDDDGDKLSEELADQAAAREALHARLTARAEKLKSVVVACAVPDAVKAYKLHPKAQTTVLFYRKLKVIDNYAFQADMMTEEDAAKIVEKVEKTLRDSKKRPMKK